MGLLARLMEWARHNRRDHQCLHWTGGPVGNDERCRVCRSGPVGGWS